MRKLLAISLSLILLLSNVSLTLASHYCGGDAVESELMLGAKNLDCGMLTTPANCETSTKTEGSFKSENCCHNEYITVHVDNLTNTAQIFHSLNLDFLQAFITLPLLFNTTTSTLSQNAFWDSPPLPKVEIGILYQVFRL